MKIKDLIAQLQKLDPEGDIVVPNQNEYNPMFHEPFLFHSNMDTPEVYMIDLGDPREDLIP